MMQNVLAPTTPQSLADAQAAAYSAIDKAAGAVRIKYITDVAGQDGTYLMKAQDATNYKAAGYPSASISSYPMVQAEAMAIYGASPTAAQFQAAADYILATQAQWTLKAAQIEQERRASKIAAGNAAAIADVLTIQAAAITALAAM